MNTTETKAKALPEDIESIKSEVTTFQTLRAEVDALQVAVMTGSKPWYKQVATIVAVLALLFSFSTTYVSFKRTKAEDIRSLKTELRGLLQRLAAMPIENLEMQIKYRDTPIDIAIGTGQLMQESSFLAQQAASIARRLPREMIFGSEYVALANALSMVLDLESALHFYDLAIETAENFNTEITALRGYAHTCYIIGNVDEGRKAYQNAIDKAGLSEELNAELVQITNVMTYLSQTFSESQIGSSLNAKKSLEKAEKISQSSQNVHQAIGSQVAEMKKQMKQGNALIRPIYGSP